MRRLFLALSLCIGLGVICVQPIQAQSASRPDPDLQFYLFASRGVVSGVKVGPSIPVEPYDSWHFGGGGEWFKVKGMAVGAELAVSPVERKAKPITYNYRTFNGKEATNTIAASNVLGWGSLNLSYHFRELPTKGKFVPFVTAGVGVIARDGLAECANYGGGFSIWRNRHRGWRVEYRKQVFDNGNFNPRFRSVRIGLVLR